MCLAILVPAAVELPKEYIANGWHSNRDGGGFAFARNGKVVVNKGYTNLDNFERALSKARKRNPNSPFLIHFRICTKGDKSQENTHPFTFEHGAAMHNGSLEGTEAVYGKGKSDTCLFIEKFGKHFTFDFLKDNKKGMEEAIGYNKMAFLFHDASYVILNDEKGTWENGVWYSNWSFRNTTWASRSATTGT